MVSWRLAAGRASARRKARCRTVAPGVNARSASRQASTCPSSLRGCQLPGISLRSGIHGPCRRGNRRRLFPTGRCLFYGSRRSRPSPLRWRPAAPESVPRSAGFQLPSSVLLLVRPVGLQAQSLIPSPETGGDRGEVQLGRSRPPKRTQRCRTSPASSGTSSTPRPSSSNPCRPGAPVSGWGWGSC